VASCLDRCRRRPWDGDAAAVDAATTDFITALGEYNRDLNGQVPSETQGQGNDCVPRRVAYAVGEVVRTSPSPAAATRSRLSSRAACAAAPWAFPPRSTCRSTKGSSHAESKRLVDEQSSAARLLTALPWPVRDRMRAATAQEVWGPQLYARCDRVRSGYGS
jgi:hypothetical protein